MKTIEYIKAHGLESLTADLAIKITDYGEFVLLNYNQYESPKFNPIVEECRGLILEKGSWKVLCRSFDRFYNQGEDPRLQTFPMNEAYVLEKIDGSLIRCWYNTLENKWCVSTRGMAYAEGLAGGSGRTFYSIIEPLLPKLENKFIGKTIIFELVSPLTQVVKLYTKARLYYLGLRDNETGEYAKSMPKSFTTVLQPKKYTFKTVGECVESAKALPQFDEGYVACANGVRMKIKSPAFVALAHLRDVKCNSSRKFIHSVLSGEAHEYLNYFPHDYERFKPYFVFAERLKSEVETVFAQYRNIESQKLFAKKVSTSPYKVLLFKMRQSHKSYCEVLEELLKKPQSLKMFLKFFNES